MMRLRRAADESDRQARRTSILEAARELFLHGDGDLPTAAEVAKAAGLAKGTVYIYFKTKEEIFGQLLLDGWSPLLKATERIFAASKKPRSRKIAAYISFVVEHLALHPELLRLDSLSAGVIEKNMTASALIAYKGEFHQRLAEAGAFLDAELNVESGRGTAILVRMYALTRGLWQIAQQAEDRCPTEIESAITIKPFSQELSEALGEYWRGALVPR
jgi:AcrR family transcriptional regulator